MYNKYYVYLFCARDHTRSPKCLEYIELSRRELSLLQNTTNSNRVIVVAVIQRVHWVVCMRVPACSPPSPPVYRATALSPLCSARFSNRIEIDKIDEVGPRSYLRKQQETIIYVENDVWNLLFFF